MQLTTLHAPSIAQWRPAILRILLSATGFGLLLSFMGVFALSDDAVLTRTIYLVLACWLGAALDIAAYALALRFAWSSEGTWQRVLVASALVMIPTGLLLWLSVRWLGREFPLLLLPVFFFNSFVVSGAFIAVFVAPAMDTAVRRADADALAAEQATSTTPPTNFMERLPRHLRDGELLALKADDHYLSAITSKGETLIRMRLADALLELSAIEGAQTHRSWWVARSAVRGVRRGAGRLSLLLSDGREAAVSRGYAKELRAAGWL